MRTINKVLCSTFATLLLLTASFLRREQPDDSSAALPASLPVQSDVHHETLPPDRSDDTLHEQESIIENTVEQRRFDYSSVPAYSGAPYTVINDNLPFSLSDELEAEPFERYSPLDDLGRCGPAIANIGTELMPTEERGAIGMVKPSGWQLVRYDDLIADHYLYNRCHLIGFQLTGENANEQNLFTGTRYLNVQGMLPIENEVAHYIRTTGNHVLYRVSPIFVDEELVARGVLIEAASVEDGGEGIRLCVFAYNVQPGIDIDYATGNSTRSPTSDQAEDPKAEGYIGNRKSKVFHRPSCPNLPAERNRIRFDSRDGALDAGFKACGNCNP